MARNNCSAMPLLAACLLSAAWSNASAQEIEPRAYSNAPIGVNFLVVGYAYTEGGLAFDPAAPLTEPELSTSGPVMAFARSLELFGKSAKFDIIAPAAKLSGSALLNGEPVERNVDGFFDTRFRVSVNLLGAPALSLIDERAAMARESSTYMESDTPAMATNSPPSTRACRVKSAGESTNCGSSAA